MFPKAAYMHTRGENVRMLLRKTLVLTCWVVGLSLLLCFSLKHVIVRVLFGGQYAEAAWMLPWYGLAMTPMAFNWILANYLLATGRYRFLYGMGASILVYGAGLAFFHRGPSDFLWVLATSGLVLLAWIAWELLKERK
jgi:O-antigen/teichoic acid export membrane protein